MKLLKKCLFVLFIVSCSSIIANSPTLAATAPLGKGLIYYTENYINNFPKSQPPVPDNQVATFSQNYIAGADCSRYLDLTDRELNYFQDLGLNFVIVGFGPASWYNLAPTKPNSPASWNDPGYKFNKLDEWLGKLQNNNLKVVLQLWGTPTWANGITPPQQNGCSNNSYPDFHPYNEPPTNFSDFADFVQAVVTRYDGTHVTNPKNNSQKLKVDTFSLWNEPNNTQGKDFWNGTVTNFVTLSNAAYDRIKSVQPTAIVWGANVLGNWSDPEGFLTATNGQLKFDVFAVHTYPANFSADANDPSNQVLFTAGNLTHLFSVLDQQTNYAGKPVAIAETGYRSNWENQFLPENIPLNEKKKGQFLKSALDQINLNNSNSRIIAVANNTLYNSWRWWSSGLINYTQPDTTVITFADLLPAYQIFKNWSLSNSANTSPNTNPPSDQTDAVYADLNNGLTTINLDRYWYLPNSSTSWTNNILQSDYFLSANAQQLQVPTNFIDAAYFDRQGNYTVIKSDKYWYRPASPTNNANWYSNTLQSAYATSPNAAQVNVPIKDIDASYFDSSGALTVIKRGQYWFRSTPSSNWYTNSLQSAYYTSPNASAVNVPTENIDASFYDTNTHLIVIKGGSFWRRSTPSSDWQTGSLASLFKLVAKTDINADGKVDIFDYNLLVTDFGKTGVLGFSVADINADGKVDIFDYNLLVGNFEK